MAKLDGTLLTLGVVGVLAAAGAARRRGSAAMSREDLTNHLAALLETLDESGEGWMPASHAYIAFGMDIGKYHQVTNVARKAGWLKKTAEVITITPQGRKMAERVRKLSSGEGSRATKGQLMAGMMSKKEIRAHRRGAMLTHRAERKKQLSQMTKAQLVERADDLGLGQQSAPGSRLLNAKKADLIDMIARAELASLGSRAESQTDRQRAIKAFAEVTGATREQAGDATKGFSTSYIDEATQQLKGQARGRTDRQRAIKAFAEVTGVTLDQAGDAAKGFSTSHIDAATQQMLGQAPMSIPGVMRLWRVVLNRPASEELGVEVEAESEKQAAELAMDRVLAGEIDEDLWDCEPDEDAGGLSEYEVTRVVDVTALSPRLSSPWDE